MVALWILQLQNEANLTGVLLGLVSAGLWLLSRKLCAAKQSEDDEDREDLLEDGLEQCRMSLQKVLQTIQAECAHLGITKDVDDISVERLRDETNKQLRAVENRDRIRVQIKGCQAEFARLKNASEGNTRSTEQEKVAGNSLQKAWGEYLQELRLPSQTEPSSVNLVFEKAETANREVRNQRLLENRHAKMTGTFDDYVSIHGSGYGMFYRTISILGSGTRQHVGEINNAQPEKETE